MVKHGKKALEFIEKLGNEIIQCDMKCRGVENNQSDGYYPRLFYLDPETASEIEILVVGENPGNSTLLEREFYKTLAERNNVRITTFKDCQRVWRTIIKEHDYYRRPKHLLKQLGLNPKGILFAEVAFCEKIDPTKSIPKETFKHCCNRFLSKIIALVPEQKYILCLGAKAFKYTIELPGRSERKLIVAYHPTGSWKFANYFEKGEAKKVTERSLKKEIIAEFKERESSKKTYVFKIK